MFEFPTKATNTISNCHERKIFPIEMLLTESNNYSWQLAALFLGLRFKPNYQNNLLAEAVADRS